MSYSKLFDSYRPRFKPGLGTFLGVGLGALGTAYGLYSQEQTNYRNLDEAKEENERNRRYQSKEADIARQWTAAQWQKQYNQQRDEWYRQEQFLSNLNRQQFLYESEYNSPQNQINRLQAAGINAGAMFGSGGSGLVSAASGNMQNVGGVSVPAGGSLSGAQASSGAASIPQMQNPMQGTSMFGSLINDLASAYQKSETTRPMVQDLLAGIDLKVKQAAGQELSNTYAEFENYVMSKTKDTKVRQALQDLSNTAADTFLKLAQGSEVNSKNLLNKADLAIKSIEKELKGLDLLEAKFRIANMETLFKAQMNMYKAKTASDYASASKSSAEADTENATRYSKRKLLDWQGNVAQMDYEIKKDEKIVSQNTVQSRIRASVLQALELGLINDELANKIRLLEKEGDWYEINTILTHISSIGSMISKFK